MRDLDLYENKYKTHIFEKVLVEYRRKFVINELKKYKAREILEVGCGLEPIFDFFQNLNL